MFPDNEPLFSPHPFWFGSRELLTDVLRTEISTLTQLLARYPHWSKLFDAPETTIQERAACFELLAHRKLIEIISNTFAERHEESPSLSVTDSNALRHAYSLVAADAPIWVLEMHQLVELLPVHIFASLPEPLRAEDYNHKNVEQMRATESAKSTLSNVEQIQALTKRVLDQQLQRLSRRWSPSMPISQQGTKTKFNRLKGTEGLVIKNDLSRYSQYLDKLTQKQQLAFRLKFEYGLGLTEISSRMEINRKTADEHIKAAQKNLDQARSSEKRKARSVKQTHDF